MAFLEKLATVLFLMLVFGSFLCPSDAWRRRRRRRRTPPVRIPPVRIPPPPPKTPVRLPYCPLDAKVRIITQKRFGRELHEYKRGARWPYNCEYASILKVGGVFNYLPLVHGCCNSCSFPSYATCTLKYGSISWRCPSEGIQCIVACVRRHDPNTGTITRPRPRPPIRGRTRLISRRFGWKKRPTMRNSKCERKVRKGGKDCIERLCIPIKLT